MTTSRAVLTTVLVFGMAGAVWAQAGNIRSDRPVVADLDFTLRRAGQRDSDLNTGRALTLAFADAYVAVRNAQGRFGRPVPKFPAWLTVV